LVASFDLGVLLWQESCRLILRFRAPLQQWCLFCSQALYIPHSLNTQTGSSLHQLGSVQHATAFTYWHAWSSDAHAGAVLPSSCGWSYPSHICWPAPHEWLRHPVSLETIADWPFTTGMCICMLPHLGTRTYWNRERAGARAIRSRRCSRIFWGQTWPFGVSPVMSRDYHGKLYCCIDSYIGTGD
jgi:hypothetical protein